MFAGRVESQYLVGSASPSGHSISSHSCDSVLRDQLVMPDADAHAREARGQPIGRAFPPRDRAPGMLGQSKRQLFGRDQIGLVAPPRIVQRFAAPLRAGAGWPHQGIRLNAGHIAQPQCRHARAQPRVVAIGDVHQHDAARQAGLAGPPDLLERDLRLGLEGDVRRHAGLVPARAILGPVLRQIQPIGHRQAGGVVGNRQRHRHLTIGLLAELPAILMLHADRMLALLGESGVVDDPRLDRPVLLDRRQHQLAHLGQHLLVRPAAPCRQNAAATGAAPPSAPEPSSPPSAPRSCARPAASGPCNSRAAAQPGPHARSRSQVPQHKPQIASRFAALSRSISPSMPNLNLPKYLILDPHGCDFVTQ